MAETLIEFDGGKRAIVLRDDAPSSRLRYGVDGGLPTNAEHALACEVRDLRQRLDDAKTDAERFRALMRCGRISMQGSAGVDPHSLERNGNNVHFGAEFWPEPLPDDYRRDHPESAAKYDASTAWGRACLMHLADAILEHEAAS